MPDGGLSPEIIDAISISNAKSIGEQPAILANLALANQIANTNLLQQNAIQNQQAMFQLQLATVAKCVELIANIDPTSSKAAAQIEVFKKLLDMFPSSTQTPPPGGEPGST